MSSESNAAANLIGLGTHIESIDGRRSSGGDEQHSQNTHQSCLACAVRAEQASNLTIGDGQVNPIESLDLTKLDFDTARMNHHCFERYLRREALSWLVESTELG